MTQKQAAQKSVNGENQWRSVLEDPDPVRRAARFYAFVSNMTPESARAAAESLAVFAPHGGLPGPAQRTLQTLREAVQALCYHAFHQMDLSRLESACLPENAASRAVLERCGFKHEGVAQSYLQINGRWRTHVLYANLRGDRRGRTDAG